MKRSASSCLIVVCNVAFIIAMVRVQRIELCSRPWEGRILATIRYPLGLVWSRCPGLNRRPTLYESAALPAELQRHSGSLLLYHPADGKDMVGRSCSTEGKLVLYESSLLRGLVVKLAYHASLSRRRSPVRIRSGPPELQSPLYSSGCFNFRRAEERYPVSYAN
jgi:hypothetical protein